MPRLARFPAERFAEGGKSSVDVRGWRSPIATAATSFSASLHSAIESSSSRTRRIRRNKRFVSVYCAPPALHRPALPASRFRRRIGHKTVARASSELPLAASHGSTVNKHRAASYCPHDHALAATSPTLHHLCTLWTSRFKANWQVLNGTELHSTPPHRQLAGYHTAAC